MSEKKFKKFINEMSFYKLTLKPQYKQYFDVIASLYLDRKIEKKSQVEKLFKKLNGRGSAPQSAVKLINKYKNYKSVKGIIKGSQPRTYHIEAKIKCRISYDRKVYIENFIESKKLYALTQQQAISEYGDDLHSRYNFITSSYESEVLSIKFRIMAVEEPEKSRTKYKYKLEDMKMKRSNTINYDYVDEHKKFNDEGISDQCVINNFIGMYPELDLTREQLITLCERFYNPSCGLDANDDEDVKKWTIDDGVSPKCINNLCEKFDITHYAYDAQQKCFIKNISRNRNHKALVYYAIDNHMYLIKDKSLVKSLSEKAKDDIKINTSMLENESKENNFNILNIYENVPIKDIIDKESCIIIYSRKNSSDINDIYKRIIGHYNVIPSPKKVVSINTKMTKFTLTLNKKLYYIYNDNNDVKLGMNWKIIKDLCKKENIEFKNQSFTTFIKQLREKILDKNSERKEFTLDERQALFKRDRQCCRACNEKITEFEIDHIRPLSNGGTNDFNNLQILCKSCHRKKCEAENEDGAYVKIIDSESSYNNKVKNIMESNLSKSYAFIEILKAKSKQKLITFDLIKCRTNRLYYGKYDYPVFTVMDNVCDYNGQTKPGIYYIESSNTYPLRGNGWYYFPMVDYCLQKQIIKPSDIKYCIISSLSIPHNYYNEFIDYCRENFDEKTCKFAINSMIGCFMMNTKKNPINSLLHVCKDSQEAFSYYYQYDGSIVNTFEIGNENYFSIFKENENMKMETESPIYNQIVQMEAVELHKLSLLVQENGGEVLDLNTDAVTCGYDGDINKILSIKYPDGEPMYRIEKKKRLENPKMPKLLRTETYSNYDLKYNIFNDVDDNDFKPLVDMILDSNKSIHIDGCAGAGKSTLIKQLQTEMDNRNLSYKTTAPTNKACNIIDGVTLHKLVTNFKKKSYIKNMNLDYIFVDEVSMMKEAFYKFLLMVKAVKPNLKFIICGDFRQLPPVNDRVENINYKNSIALYELCDGNRLQLNKCRRANSELYDLCSPENIPKIEKKDFNNELCDFNICYTNKRRISINDKIMKEKFKLRKPKKGKYLKLDKYYFDDNSQDVILISNTPLISRKTDEKMGVIKNEFYQIEKIDGDKIILNNGLVFTDHEQFQKYFYVAYAITTHKSQGCTFDFNYSIHEWHKMDDSLKYVSLSRSTNKNLINII